MKKVSLILIISLCLSACQEVATGVVESVAHAAEISTKEKEQKEEKRKNGTFTQTNERTGISTTFTLKDGWKEGPAFMHYRNGKLWKEVHYKNDDLHGEAKVYYKNGSLKRVVNYSFGLKHGDYIAYFKSGNEKIRVNYVHDYPLPGAISRDAYGKEEPTPRILYTETEERLEQGDLMKTLEFSFDDDQPILALYAFPAKEDYLEKAPDFYEYKLPRSDKQGYFIRLRTPAREIRQYTLHLFALYEIKRGLPATSYRKLTVEVRG